MTADEYVVKKLEEAEKRADELYKHNTWLREQNDKLNEIITDIVEKMEVCNSDYFGRGYRIQSTEICMKDTPKLVKFIDEIKMILERIEEEKLAAEKEEGAV